MWIFLFTAACSALLYRAVKVKLPVFSKVHPMTLGVTIKPGPVSLLDSGSPGHTVSDAIKMKEGSLISKSDRMDNMRKSGPCPNMLTSQVLGNPLKVSLRLYSSSNSDLIHLTTSSLNPCQYNPQIKCKTAHMGPAACSRLVSHARATVLLLLLQRK